MNGNSFEHKKLLNSFGAVRRPFSSENYFVSATKGILGDNSRRNFFLQIPTEKNEETFWNSQKIQLEKFQQKKL